MIGERFASTRAHYDKDIVTGEGGVDDFFLMVAKVFDVKGVAEVVKHLTCPRVSLIVVSSCAVAITAIAVTVVVALCTQAISIRIDNI